MDCEKNTISPEHTVYAPGHKYMINHVFVYAKTPRRGEACKKSKILSNQNHYKLLPQTPLPRTLFHQQILPQPHLQLFRVVYSFKYPFSTPPLTNNVNNRKKENVVQSLERRIVEAYLHSN